MIWFLRVLLEVGAVGMIPTIPTVGLYVFLDRKRDIIAR